MGGQVETIQTTELLRSGRILRRVLETSEDNRSCDNSQLSEIIVIIKIMEHEADSDTN